MTVPPPTRLPRISPTMVRYVGVGLLSLVVDAGTLWLLYDVAGRPLWLATTAGFWLSFVVNFLANKYFTFGVRTDGTRQLLRYGLLVVLNYLANLGIVTGLVAVGLPAVLAKVIAVALLTGLNFFAYRHWVFRS
ncbi:MULTISPECIES: GtrA family protein [unclassified Modestobacter]|uniref:GtrA family protein n=1 Tax=unclassified Modestobacter TaxID=2643866 RepID=UPI0022AA1F6F|nr:MULTISPECIES: GtrA family protein [unclassified Modestobacter]MCZ2812317.1 GtrA family protein [Modestobacter sp. VKM Ac-2979]MCZ2841207.1 GtrA family protein [Modestobacter sp. VKM Ac-2980]MCZ2848489.1 GtrA family protein [Modestobacter sp. VKM Ac-2978]